MILIQDKYKCCGCSACVQACPKRCISFEEDNEGFRYPIVDKDNCIDCHRCEKVCPYLNQKESSTPLFAFAQINNNKEVRIASSSGGIFSLIAENVLKNGGVVFGAVFDDNWEVKHDFTEFLEELEQMRTSKYVQSQIGDTFIKAKNFLDKGRLVLFVGTSCQIAALKLFLRKDYSNLLAIDFICHGVPSPKVWRKYLKEITNKAKQNNRKLEIGRINFRDKRLGWNRFSLTVLFKSTSSPKESIVKVFSDIFPEDDYMRSFLSNLNLRPSCYNCPAKNGKSGADITLADFWGVEKILPDLNDDKGVSLTIIHTKKGQKALDGLNAYTIEIGLDEAINSNPTYVNSVAEPLMRNVFFERVTTNESLNHILKDVLGIPFLANIKHGIKRKICSILGRVLNRDVDVTKSLSGLLMEALKK